MSDTKTFGAMYEFSPFELRDHPSPPSQMLRDREARMVARMAEEVHLAGYRFDGWPKFELKTDTFDGRFGSGRLALHGEVNATKLG